MSNRKNYADRIMTSSILYIMIVIILYSYMWKGVATGDVQDPTTTVTGVTLCKLVVKRTARTVGKTRI